VWYRGEGEGCGIAGTGAGSGMNGGEVVVSRAHGQDMG
jgi:hypothetical protein